MAIAFSHRVMIRNPRLQCLYIVACLVLAVGFIVKFAYALEHLEFYNVQDYVHVSTSAVFDGFQDSRATVQEAINSVCVDGVACMPLCGFENPPVPNVSAVLEPVDANIGIDCIHSSSLGVTVDSDSVFYMTRMEEKHTVSSEAREWLMPYEHSLKLHFSYSFSIPKKEQTTFPESRFIDLHGWSSPKYSRVDGDILTVFVDHDGQVVYDSRTPGDTLGIEVPRMLELAGLGSDWLDRKQGGSERTGRATGIKLFLSVTCFDYDSHWQFSRHVFDALADKWRGPRCEVRVIPSTERSGRRDLESATTSLIVRNRYGVHVAVRTGGRMSRFSYERIYVAVVSAIVLSKLPKMFVLVITVSLLGHLSRIYKRVIFEPFDIAEQVAGTSTRFMANTVAFEELCELGEQDIAKETMLRRIGEAMMHRTDILNSHEIEIFVNFCHKAIVDLQTFRKTDLLSHELRHDLRLPGRERLASLGDDLTPVDIHSFSAACSSVDKVRIMDVMRLFDAHRKMAFLERLFMPAYIRKLVLKAAAPTSEPVIDMATLVGMTTTTETRNTLESQASDGKHSTIGGRALQRVLHLEGRLEGLLTSGKQQRLQSKFRNVKRTDPPHGLVSPGPVSRDSTFSAESRPGASCDSQDQIFSRPRHRTGSAVSEATATTLTRSEVEHLINSALKKARVEIAEGIDILVQEEVRSIQQQIVAEVVETATRLLEQRGPSRTSVCSGDSKPVTERLQESSRGRSRTVSIDSCGDVHSMATSRLSCSSQDPDIFRLLQNQLPMKESETWHERRRSSGKELVEGKHIAHIGPIMEESLSDLTASEGTPTQQASENARPRRPSGSKRASFSDGAANLEASGVLVTINEEPCDTAPSERFEVRPINTGLSSEPFGTHDFEISTLMSYHLKNCSTEEAGARARTLGTAHDPKACNAAGKPFGGLLGASVQSHASLIAAGNYYKGPQPTSNRFPADARPAGSGANRSEPTPGNGALWSPNADLWGLMAGTAQHLRR